MGILKGLCGLLGGWWKASYFHNGFLLNEERFVFLQ